ncbi:hypothetical protein [Streptomyces sp. NBC_00334]|uniref:hypothetical protein n=1 Tax=Streptomyces sp. NBC_00334 TaxID=2975713 RepID=UPI002E2BFB51|nr:hypothetical protein [Streptomyces sp. NBC_00334]
MTPLERLIQESVPARPEKPDVPHSLWTQQEQDRHWTDLCEAMRVPGQKRPARPATPAEAQHGHAA